MKKLSVIFGLLAILILFQNCKKNVKYKKDDVKIEVILENPYNLSSPATKYANEMVYLRLKGSETYLYAAKTDNKGVAVFSLLKENTEYEVFVRDTIDDLPFEGVLKITSDQRDLMRLNIVPQTSEFNGFRIKCVDDQNAGIPGVDVCLFESRVLADAGDCSFSTFSGKSSAQGFFMMTKIPAKRYYISIVDTVANIPIGIHDSIDVFGSGLIYKEIVVFP